MDTKKLRQKILDLAIRGKLVPQDPNDEPASALIEKIRQEKEQLIKEKKIKRNKNESHIYRSDKSYYEKFPDGTVKCVDDEIPFEVPESWEWVRLESLCSIITDGTHKTPVYSNSGYIFLSSKNVTSGKIDWDNVKYIPEFLHEELYKRLAPQVNDILLAKNGTTGVAAIVDRDCIFDIYVSLALLRPVINGIYPNFFLYSINSPYSKSQFDSHLKGIGVPNLHLEHIKKVLLPLPPLAEQKRIVSKIENAFLFVEDLEKNKSDLKQYIQQAKSKVLDLAIRGKLVPQDPSDEPASVLLERIKSEHPDDKKKASKTSDNSHYRNLPFEIPESWEWMRLGDISTVLYGVSESAQTEGNYKLLRITDIQNNSVNWDGVPFTTLSKDRAINYLLKEDDILFARTGATVGKSYLIQEVENNVIYASYLIRVRLIEKLISQYIKYYFESGFYWRQIIDKSVGVGQPNVNGTSLKSLLIPIPPFNEQFRIVSKLESIFSTLNSIIAEL